MRINTINCVIGISNRELLWDELTQNVAISFFQPVLIHKKVSLLMLYVIAQNHPVLHSPEVKIIIYYTCWWTALLEQLDAWSVSGYDSMTDPIDLKNTPRFSWTELNFYAVQV